MCQKMDCMRKFRILWPFAKETTYSILGNLRSLINGVAIIVTFSKINKLGSSNEFVKFQNVANLNKEHGSRYSRGLRRLRDEQPYKLLLNTSQH